VKAASRTRHALRCIRGGRTFDPAKEQRVLVSLTRSEIDVLRAARELAAILREDEPTREFILIPGGKRAEMSPQCR
jgi:hypothetical protein